ncbi:MAG: PAS domain-containing protein [Gemmatales bacterium]|nr:PAS domain-containing protein [Gemmatales bacterium]MDW8387050.1 PAS domain-containing protein [Gemmatales bacterium]
MATTAEDIAALQEKVRYLEGLVESYEQTLLDQANRLELAMQELKQQTSILQSVLNSIGDGVAVISKDGRFLLNNPASVRILGINVGEDNYKNWSENYESYRADGQPYDPNDLPLARAIRGEEVDEAEEFMRHWRRPEGVWLSVTARPLRDEKGQVQGGVAVFRDVTRRKRTERHLAAQYAVVRVLAEASTLDQAAHGLVRAACESLGLQFGAMWEVRQNLLHCLAVWPEQGEVAELVRLSQSPLGSDSRGLPVQVWKSGQPLWIGDLMDEDGSPRATAAWHAGMRTAFAVPIVSRTAVTGVLEFYSDQIRACEPDLIQLLGSLSSLIGQFCERKHAEEALRDSEALFHSLVETLPLNILRKDLQGRFIFANQLFCKNLGKPLNEILGRTDYDFFPRELAEKYRADDRRVLATQKVFEDIEAHVTPAGDKLYVHVLKAPVWDAAGKVIGVQVIFWDETARKVAEEKLQQTLAELARSNRELELFAYVASHDLQEPLRMVSSYCQLLQRRYKDKLDEDANEFISYAVDGALRMQTLINDLLAYSRVGTRGKPLVPTSSESALIKAMNNLKLAIEESGAEITHDPLPMVVGDTVQLTQLFQNLLGNALKFRGQEPPRISVGAERQGAFWKFWVQDNGIGIDPADFDRIFIIFQRLHSRDEYPGTGIGLAICKKIVERHGGKIWVESAKGQGAKFLFTLPAAEGSGT